MSDALVLDNLNLVQLQCTNISATAQVIDYKTWQVTGIWGFKSRQEARPRTHPFFPRMLVPYIYAEIAGYVKGTQTQEE